MFYADFGRVEDVLDLLFSMVDLGHIAFENCTAKTRFRGSLKIFLV